MASSRSLSHFPNALYRKSRHESLLSLDSDSHYGCSYYGTSSTGCSNRFSGLCYGYIVSVSRTLSPVVLSFCSLFHKDRGYSSPKGRVEYENVPQSPSEGDGRNVNEDPYLCPNYAQCKGMSMHNKPGGYCHKCRVKMLR